MAAKRNEANAIQRTYEASSINIRLPLAHSPILSQLRQRCRLSSTVKRVKQTSQHLMDESGMVLAADSSPCSWLHKHDSFYTQRRLCCPYR
jgi:hypothetical protein